MDISRDDVFKQARVVMSRIFDQPVELFGELTSASDVEGWDSLSHLVLVAGLEKKFNINLPKNSANMAQNVGELVDLIHAGLAHRALP
jgi:acyl carrier protein